MRFLKKKILTYEMLQNMRKYKASSLSLSLELTVSTRKWVPTRQKLPRGASAHLRSIKFR